MNICVDASPMLQQFAGIARYGREMLPRLRNQARDDQISIFFNNRGRVAVPSQHSDLARYSVGWGNKLWRLRVAADYLLGRDLDAAFPGVDVFFATDHLLPRFRRIRSVINIRDLSFQLQPEFHNRLSRLYQQRMMPRFACHADMIIVPSRATHDDLRRHYAVPTEKISVIPEGVDARFLHPVTPPDVARARDRYGMKGRYLLYLGTLEPRKNVDGLLAAYAALLARGEAGDVRLVLAGKPGWRYGPTLAHIAALGLESRVQRVGFVAEDDLPALYAGAEAFVFPSFYEGFGLPVLEALAAGAPVITSSVSSLPEVVGEAGLLVDPQDGRALAEAIGAVLRDGELRARLRAAGPPQARRFSWERTAEATLALLRKLGG
jgi:glycosyltransferase involved in cell wall biosynthesis